MLPFGTFPNCGSMCEFSAETLSDSDGDEDLAHQNMYNAVLDAMSNYHYGELLESCLTDSELGRLSLTCTLHCIACVTIGTCSLRVMVTCERWNGYRDGCACSAALRIRRRKRGSELCSDWMTQSRGSSFADMLPVRSRQAGSLTSSLLWKWRPYRCGVPFSCGRGVQRLL